ncbi:uncharacterized protein LOC143028821 [Oratosquilla oratoria]|uniref:uncharacterized protein LOC143028821 n=1 Tax=Oratosquilla oratoria TaxID=337810 RepID=UPI003F765B7F
MAKKNTLTALDITLRDILENDKFMGGKVVICAGDFRQILPVIRGGGKNDELEYCIKSSYMWGDITKLKLTANVRLMKNYTNNIKFAQKLLEIGSQNDGPLELEEGFGVQRIVIRVEVYLEVTSDDGFEVPERLYEGQTFLLNSGVMAL